MMQENLLRPPVVVLQPLAPLLKSDRVDRALRVSCINGEDVSFTPGKVAEYLRLWNEIDRNVGSGGWKRTLEPAVPASTSKPMSIITCHQGQFTFAFHSADKLQTLPTLTKWSHFIGGPPFFALLSAPRICAKNVALFRFIFLNHEPRFRFSFVSSSDAWGAAASCLRPKREKKPPFVSCSSTGGRLDGSARVLTLTFCSVKFSDCKYEWED